MQVDHYRQQEFRKKQLYQSEHLYYAIQDHQHQALGLQRTCMEEEVFGSRCRVTHWCRTSSGENLNFLPPLSQGDNEVVSHALRESYSVK